MCNSQNYKQIYHIIMNDFAYFCKHRACTILINEKCCDVEPEQAKILYESVEMRTK